MGRVGVWHWSWWWLILAHRRRGHSPDSGTARKITGPADDLDSFLNLTRTCFGLRSHLHPLVVAINAELIGEMITAIASNIAKDQFVRVPHCGHSCRPQRSVALRPLCQMLRSPRTATFNFALRRILRSPATDPFSKRSVNPPYFGSVVRALSEKDSKYLRSH
jgi:hypothetical protein